MKQALPRTRRSKAPTVARSIETILRRAYRLHRWDRLSRAALRSAV